MGGLLLHKHSEFAIKNPKTWFEIPALNFDRAVPFYSHINGIEIEKIKSGDYSMDLFPKEKDGIDGSVLSGNGAILIPPLDTMRFFSIAKGIN